MPLKYFFAVCIVLVVAVGAIRFVHTSRTFGSATPGTQATIATSSNPSVTNSAALVFATSTCQARTVTTYASPILLYFSDLTGQRPTGVAGHLQAASTTTTYDASAFGCGAVYVFSYTSQSITVSEAR